MYELTTDEKWLIFNIVEDIKYIFTIYNERTDCF